MDSEMQTLLRPKNAPWNKGRITGQKRPLKPKDVWAIRVRLQLEHRARDLALFNLAIDSKLRGCDLVRLQVDDVCAGDRVRDRATVTQKKTSRPVQFEITEQTRASIQAWLPKVDAKNGKYLFPSRFRAATAAGGELRGAERLAARPPEDACAVWSVSGQRFRLQKHDPGRGAVGKDCPKLQANREARADHRGDYLRAEARMLRPDCAEKPDCEHDCDRDCDHCSAAITP